MGKGRIVKHYCGMRIKTGLSRQRQIVADVVALDAVTFSQILARFSFHIFHCFFSALPYLLSVVPCSFRALICCAALPSRPAFYVVSVCQNRDLLTPFSSAFTSRWTPLVLSYDLPATKRSRDFHSLKQALAGHTIENSPVSIKLFERCDTI